MKANIHVGEVGVAYEGWDYIFRPSFYAMSKLGTPKEIVDYFYKLQDGGRRALDVAHHVLSCCYNGDKDLLPVIGYSRPVKGKLKFIQGAMPANDVIILAFHLLKMGTTGKIIKKSKGKGTGSFDPVEFIGSAVAYLEVSPESAWNMTMTEFQHSMRAKFPDTKEEEEITRDDLDDIMAWADEYEKRNG